MKRLLFMFALTALIAGCTSKVLVFDKQEYDNSLDVSELVVGMPSFAISEHIFDTRDPQELDEHLKEFFTEFDIPLTMTPRVNYYLKYFTGSGRPVMQKWLDRSNKYSYMVRQRFQLEGIPTDLLVLAITESGYNPMAYSHAGAAGMWQFMPSTGKIYGLNINEWVDERRDFEKATDAAARHLKDLNKSFGDWYLALAAYNAGHGRISRATKAHKSQDFFKIASGSTLKLETRDYVPKYLAQLIIFKNMREYGFKTPQELPLVYKTVSLNRQANLYVLAGMLGCSYSQLKELNPELLTPMTPPIERYNIRVPLELHDGMLALVEGRENNLSRYSMYKARSGEKIVNIAKKYGVSAALVKEVNGFSYDSIYTNKILFIPSKNMVIEQIDKDFAKEIAKLSPKYHKVRKGDNMTLISRKYNIPLNALVKMNPKVNPRRIYPGQVIVISQGFTG